MTDTSAEAGHSPTSRFIDLVEHRLNEDEAVEVMHDLVVTNPRRAFKL